jgi:hypothetical protein
MTDLSALEDVEVVTSDDAGWPALVCPRCNGEICTVEDRDTWGLLSRTALDHMASCTAPSPSPEIEHEEVPC